MRADLSRDTFDASNGYHAVILAMGRALLDADFNEQGALTRHLAREAARDVIGQNGVPRTGGGFAIAPTADGSDLAISTGRIYVDGLVVDNQPQVCGATAATSTVLKLDTVELDDTPLVVGDELEIVGSEGVLTVQSLADRDVTLTSPHGVAAETRVEVRRVVSLKRQPFTFRESVVIDGSPLGPGRFVAVLRGCLREETSLDRPGIAEVALGGPETTTRIRMVWQVLLSKVGDQGTGSCADWVPPERSARLRPSLQTPTAGTGDCALPPEAAFRGVEHCLIRVEVNDVDGAGKITSLLYDKDNASVAALITDLKQTVTLQSFGARGAAGVGGFDNGQTVTVTDRHLEWDGASAQVATTSNADPSKRTLDLSAPPIGDPDARPRLRRWSGHFDDVSEGQLVELEDGVWIEITGHPRVGDYWMIPARSAFGGPGDLDWPRDQHDAFRALPAHGPDEVWCPLAVVDFDGSTFTAPADSDCRTIFPPLTAITADDVSYDDTSTVLGADTVQDALEKLYLRGGGGCTFTVEPVAGWEQALLDIPADLDARICFRAGDYPAAGRVVLQNKGSLVFQGIGPATVIHATGDEVALSIENCKSVTIRDVAFVAEGSTRPPGDGLMGALSISGTPQVDIANVTASCSSGTDPRSTCITVRGPGATATNPAALGRALSTRISVRDCLLSPGEYQIGLLVQDFERCDVAGVVVEGPPASGFFSIATFPKVLLGRLKKAMISGLKVVDAGVQPGAPGHPVGVPVGLFPGRPIGSIKEISSGGVSFQTPGRVAQPWRDALLANPVPEANIALARAHLFDLAGLAFKPQPDLKLKPLRDALDGVLATRVPVISQGIVVVGGFAGTVRIAGCQVRRSIQGLHVAVSNRKTSPGARTKIGRVILTDNQIEVGVPPEDVGGKHGIFVGHAASVLLADNVVTIANQALNPKISGAAMRLGGFFGSDIVVRDNHASDFVFGLQLRTNFDAALPPTKTRWLVRGNFFERIASPDHIDVEPVGYPAGSAPSVLRVENNPA